MAVNVDWGPIIAALINVALPWLLENLPAFLDAIKDWLLNTSNEEVVALGSKIGKFMNAAKTEMA